jgi:hypothetical protein
MLDPAEIAGARAGRRHVEPQRIGRARFEPSRAFSGRKQLGRTGIEWCAVGIARPSGGRLALRHQRGHLGAALETRIDQALGCEFFERRVIIREMPGLPPHRRLPREAEPAEILINRGLEFRLAPDGVDILDAQQQSAAGAARAIEIQQRRIGMAEMKIAVRARRKAEDGRRH